MRQQPGTRESSSERLVKNIRRVTRKQYSSEEKSASYWMVCAVSSALPSCAGVRVSPRAYGRLSRCKGC